MNKPLLDVLNGRAPGRRPIWFMRQAGRYLPEYRAVRDKAGSFLDLCYNPKLACEVTLQPLRRFDLDAAILFSDILVVPHAMGLGLRFEDGEGPVLETVMGRDSLDRLQHVKNTRFVKRVCETVSLVRSQLGGDKTLIGFCGGPWTVASYMVEGGSSDRVRAKVAAYMRNDWFVALIERLIEESVDYLCSQIEAGAEAVQIFDSWAGELPGELGREFVEMPLVRMVRMLKDRHPGVPVIVFAKGYGVRQVELARVTGAAALGIEAELPLDWVAKHIGKDTAIQGNLDPVALLGSDEVVRTEANGVARSVPMERHIFNLGHGIRQGTDPRAIEVVVRSVREFDGGGND